MSHLANPAPLPNDPWGEEPVHYEVCRTVAHMVSVKDADELEHDVKQLTWQRPGLAAQIQIELTRQLDAALCKVAAEQLEVRNLKSEMRRRGVAA